MTIRTIPTSDPYLRAACESVDLTANAQYLQKRAQQMPAYTMAKADYQQFRIHGYQAPRTWQRLIGRKLSHLPNSLWCGAVKAPLHTLKAFTIGPCQGTFKTSLYRAGCDIQEAKGHVLGLVSEPWCEFHLADSRLHKQCYDIIDATPRAPSKKQDGYIVGREFDIKSGEYKSPDSAIKDLAARYVGLTQKQLDETSIEDIPSVVKGLNCERLFMLKFTKQQLRAIPLNQLSKHQIDGLFPPFKMGASSQSTNPHLLQWEAHNKKRAEKKRLICFVRLRAFSSLELDAIKGMLEPECLALHQAALAYNDITNRGLITDLFRKFDTAIIIQALLTEELTETIQRLHDIDMEILNRLLQHLPMNVLFGLAPETLQKLDLSFLTDEQLNAFFDIKKKKECQPFVNHFTSKQISTALSRLSVIQIQTFDFSNEQLEELDLTKLNLRQLQALLPLFQFSELSGGPLAQIQKKHAEKQLLVLKRLDAFKKKEQHAVIEKKLPGLWSLYQDWKNNASNQQLDALQSIVDFAVKLPPRMDPVKSKPDPVETDVSSSEDNRSVVTKTYDFAVWFLGHVWNGLCIVTNVVTYPFWKPYQIFRTTFISTGDDLPLTKV